MIQYEINKAVDAARIITEQSLKVIPEKQYNNTDPMRAFACWFTTFHMYFKYRFPLSFSLSWEEFKTKCVECGGIKSDFTILDVSGKPSMIAKAAGQNLVREDATKDISAKCLDLLAISQPIPVSLNGEHYELITGKKEVLGMLCFEVVDPGWQNDEFINCLTLEAFKVVNGKAVFSKGHDGGHRKVTRVFWFE